MQGGEGAVAVKRAGQARRPRQFVVLRRPPAPVMSTRSSMSAVCARRGCARTAACATVRFLLAEIELKFGKMDAKTTKSYANGRGGESGTSDTTNKAPIAPYCFFFLSLDSFFFLGSNGIFPEENFPSKKTSFHDNKSRGNPTRRCTPNHIPPWRLHGVTETVAR